jgi:uncharacterized cupredoxin-like copper-binding protein
VGATHGIGRSIGEGVAMWRRGSTGGPRRASFVAALTLVAVMALVGSACSKSTPTASGPTTYSVFVQKFRFHGLPATFKGGNITINFSNRESLSITHEMVLVALQSGKTSQNIIDDAKTGGTDSEDEWLHFGEIPDVDTGATKAGLFDLPPGTYAIACWQTGNLGGGEGDPHAARGMVFQFTVSP